MKTQWFEFAVVLFVLFVGTSAFAAEGRIPIDDARNCATGAGTITEPGSYFLSNDIDNLDDSGTCTEDNAIIIDADHVTIDLQGHTITVGTAGHSGIFTSGHTDIHIKNGKITVTDGSGLAGIDFYGSAGEFRIENLTITGFPVAGIAISGDCATTRARAVVTGNSVKATEQTSTWAGIYLGCVESSRVEQNQLRDADEGIYLASTEDTIVRNNVTSGNKNSGIVLDTSHNIILETNLVTKNGTDGILLINASSNNTITNNNASSNGQATSATSFCSTLGYSAIIGGIHLCGDSNYNNLSNNTTSKNIAGGHGIFLDGTATGPSENNLDWNQSSGNGGCGFNFTGAGTSANILSNNRARANTGEQYCPGLPGSQADAGGNY